MATSIFVQSAGPSAEGRAELARVFGAGTTQRVVQAIAIDRGALTQGKKGLAFVLRQLARGLYVSPIFLIASLVLRAIDGPAGFVVVAFCSLVVAFFVTLNVYVVWSLVSWLTRKRRTIGIARWRPLEPRLLPAAGWVRVVGKVERLEPGSDDVVLRDFWADDVISWRLTETAVFLVRPDDASAEPLVVACTTAPEVTGRASSRDRAMALGGVSPEARALVPATADAVGRGVLLTIATGDRVEVLAERTEPVENLDRIPLPGGEVLVGEREGDPYRDQPNASPRAGKLARDQPTAPLRIRRLR